MSLTFLNHPTAHSMDSMCPEKQTNKPISYWYTRKHAWPKHLFGSPASLLFCSDELMSLELWKVNSAVLKSTWTSEYLLYCLLGKVRQTKLSIWYIPVEMKYEMRVNLLKDYLNDHCCVYKQNFRSLGDMDVETVMTSKVLNKYWAICLESGTSHSIPKFICHLGPKSAKHCVQTFFFSFFSLNFTGIPVQIPLKSVVDFWIDVDQDGNLGLVIIKLWVMF